MSRAPCCPPAVRHSGGCHFASGFLVQPVQPVSALTVPQAEREPSVLQAAVPPSGDGGRAILRMHWVHVQGPQGWNSLDGQS